jgi:hypothetical protein
MLYPKVGPEKIFFFLVGKCKSTTRPFTSDREGDCYNYNSLQHMMFIRSAAPVCKPVPLPMTKLSFTHSRKQETYR